MRRYFLLFVCLIYVNVYADPVNMDSLLQCLDNAIAHSPEYVAQKQAKIDALKQQLPQCSIDELRWVQLLDLYREYKAFNNDSAIHYLSLCAEEASAAGQNELANQCRARLAFQCSTSGLYLEAHDILASIDAAHISTQNRGLYEIAKNHLYNETAYYTQLPQLRDRYYAIADSSLQRLMGLLNNSDDEYLQRKEIGLCLAGQYDEAIRINDLRMSKVTPESREFAIVAFYRYLDYKTKGDSTEALQWVTRSAICDVQHAVMDQGSMWELANLLESSGDWQRGHRYISFAWDCANRFGTRMRSWQISPILSSIENTYQEEVANRNKQLRIMIFAVSILAFLLLATLFYVYRQRNKLAQAHRQLEQKNRELADLNEQLEQKNEQMSEVNKQLQQLNGELSMLNMQLTESNKVKEEYIGRFLSLCSTYIDKMDSMRKRVNKLAKAHNYEELMKITTLQDRHEHDLEELYENFDSAFLHLFPNFLYNFNQLLRPEERFVLESPTKLNTSLRIFALIRLGIDDSGKIAEFLHYSSNTIYNYRARVKNAAISNRENFEKQVKQIG